MSPVSRAPMHELIAPRVAVVGNGAAGLLTVVALRRRGLAVDWYGDADSAGAGLAYGPAAGGRRLNSRADRMGVGEDDPGHFADWLGLQGAARHGFAPRAVYGAYLRGEAERLQAADAQRLRRFPQRVLAVQAAAAGYQVHDQSGASRPAAACVLALGMPMCGRPTWVDAAAWRDPGYLQQPLCGDALSGLPGEARVLVLGSGLSMVDAVVDLLAAGHAGPIVALSRHGQLPARHAPGAPAVAEGEWIDRCARTGGLRVARLLRRLREEVAAGADWRALIDGLRARSQQVWNALPAVDQRRFERHLAAWWNTHRHRSPAEIADRVDDAIESGQLRLRAARIRGLLREGAGFRVALRGGEDLLADAVLHCLGPDLRIAQHPDPLVRQLLDVGLAQAHPSGVGFAADRQQRLLPARADTAAAVFALGGLLRGVDPDQTAVPELRAAARTIAQQIAEQLSRAGAAG